MLATKSGVAVVFVLALLAAIFIVANTLLLDKVFLKNEAYSPEINPEDFVSGISNKYFAFSPGKKFVYEGKTEEGIERTEVLVTNETRKVMGVNAIVVWDRVLLNGKLVEDTKDWYAQDRHGNVWYFGEDSKEFVKGKVVSTKGSWEAGVDGAKPGIVMKANPQIGERYRQEYYRGEAEDMAEVVSVGVNVTMAYGSFSGCIQTREWTPLDPGDEEYKYYCPEVGMVYEAKVGSGEGAQLVGVESSAAVLKQTETKVEPLERLKAGITEQEAIAIAQKAVNGKVTDVGIEEKFGKAAYVVEIDADGVETDVIIDIDTGEVLGIET